MKEQIIETLRVEGYGLFDAAAEAERVISEFLRSGDKTRTYRSREHEIILTKPDIEGRVRHG